MALVRHQSKSCRDVAKLSSIIEVLAACASCCPDTAFACIEAMVNALGHGFARIRALAAERLYTILLTVDDVEKSDGGKVLADGSDVDEASTILLDVSWSTDVQASRNGRAQVAALLGVKVVAPKTQKATDNKERDEGFRAMLRSEM